MSKTSFYNVHFSLQTNLTCFPMLYHCVRPSLSEKYVRHIENVRPSQNISAILTDKMQLAIFLNFISK